MKLNEKSLCSFQNWYPSCKDFSIKSVFLALPADVLTYLKSDIVTIPVEAVLSKVKNDKIDDVSYSNWDSDGEDEDEAEAPSFPDFSAKLKDVLDSFGGKVFIKMNWSAPTDAAWVATNNCLKCSNLQDIYLLLKCSDKISRDLDISPGRDNIFYLVLKKWEDIHPGTEFRCFVTDNELIAVTQRDKSEFHRHILESKHRILRDIKQFYRIKLKNKILLSSYIFDIVWNPNTLIKLVDISMFNDKESDSYLFSWEELKELKFNEEASPEFRFIGEDTGIQPVNLSQHFGMPRDLTDVTHNTSQSLIELLQSQLDIQSTEDQ